MQSEVKHTDTEETELIYPYVGICTSNMGTSIVLFTSKNTGMSVADVDNDGDIGDYASDWTEDKFTPFLGTITLSN